MKLWKEEVAKTSQKASDALADPEGYENLFPDFKDSLKAEQVPRLRQCVCVYVCVSVCAHHFHGVHVMLSADVRCRLLGQEERCCPQRTARLKLR